MGKTKKNFKDFFKRNTTKDETVEVENEKSNVWTGLSYPTIKKLSVGVDLEEDKKQMTYIIYDIDVIREISSLCIPKAGESEFQVGYEGLHIEVKKNDKIVNFMIPLAYYNFKQEVTSAHIDYELEDVTDSFNAISNVKDISCFDDLIQKLNSLSSIGFEVNYYRGDFGSIHRHPSRITFSMTDLNNDPDNPGIIYRKGTFKGLQTDSIIYIPESKSEKTELFYSESRRIDIEFKEDVGISGTYQENKTINVIYRKDGFYEENISFDDILNLNMEAQNDRKEFKYYTNVEENGNKLLEFIMEEYDKSEFEPDISAVNPDNISAKRYSFSTINGYSYADIYGTKESATTKVESSITSSSYNYYGDEITGVFHLYDGGDKYIETIEDDIRDIGSKEYPLIKYQDKYFSASNDFTEFIDGFKYKFDIQEYMRDLEEIERADKRKKEVDDLFDFSQYDI